MLRYCRSHKRPLCHCKSDRNRRQNHRPINHQRRDIRRRTTTTARGRHHHRHPRRTTRRRRCGESHITGKTNPRRPNPILRQHQTRQNTDVPYRNNSCHHDFRFERLSGPKRAGQERKKKQRRGHQRTPPPSRKSTYQGHANKKKCENASATKSPHNYKYEPSNDQSMYATPNRTTRLALPRRQRQPRRHQHANRRGLLTNTQQPEPSSLPQEQHTTQKHLHRTQTVTKTTTPITRTKTTPTRALLSATPSPPSPRRP